MASAASVQGYARNLEVLEHLVAFVESRGVDVSAARRHPGSTVQLSDLPTVVLVDAVAFLAAKGAVVTASGPASVSFRLGRGSQACAMFLSVAAVPVRDGQALAVASAVLGLERLVSAGCFDEAVAEFGAVAVGFLRAGRRGEAFREVAELALHLFSAGRAGMAPLRDEGALLLATLLADEVGEFTPGHPGVAAGLVSVVAARPELVSAALLLDVLSPGVAAPAVRVVPGSVRGSLGASGVGVG
jgi:hypothetical protein